LDDVLHGMDDEWEEALEEKEEWMPPKDEEKIEALKKMYRSGKLREI
jgi:hypothetical protein